MDFRIRGLARAQFADLFGLPDAVLAARGILRRVADRSCGFPDRIELRDAEPGEPLLLLNYTHQDADSPFRASHAIYVSERALQTYDAVNRVPEAMRRRVLSLRAFDRHGMLRDADLVDGRELEGTIARLLDDPDTAYLHAHYAKPGCYAARIDAVMAPQEGNAAP